MKPAASSWKSPRTVVAHTTAGAIQLEAASRQAALMAATELMPNAAVLRLELAPEWQV